MPSRSRRTAEERAEARRRARLAARGVEVEEAPEPDEAQAADGGRRPAEGGFLSRLFPPAPPLPNKPDPLQGYGYEGPFRGVLAGFYLLSRNPLAWVATGIIWSLGRLLTTGSPLGLLASLISFGALILAGWLGWQRPWLFGLVASILGILMFAGSAAAISAGTPTAEAAPLDVFLGLIYFEVVGLQPLFGVVAGWYGGYLRRRMAATSAQGRRQPGRRR